MVYKYYRTRFIARVILLTINIALFFFLLFSTDLPVTTICVGLLACTQIFSLIRYSESVVRELDQFIRAIDLNDYTIKFPSEGSRGPIKDLRKTFNRLIGQFREVRRESEEQAQYLQSVVNHVPVGLMAVEADGKLSFHNNAVKKLIDVKLMRTVDDIGDERVVALIKELKSGQRRVLKTEFGGEVVRLSFRATEIRQRGRIIKLVSIQNITGELAEQEVEAWHQLVRVLTHEIMNSVTPVASLASTVNDMLDNELDTDTVLNDNETIKDIRDAVRAIKKRGEGLVHFVEAYRGLSNIPAPNLEETMVTDLLERTRKLILSRSESDGIEIEVLVKPENLSFPVDPDLIEQVLLNLAINAVQSLSGRENSRIRMIGTTTEQNPVIIQVIDNGPGISSEAMDKLFVPFFSTKPGGTGIGLSLSQQIMRRHGGSISVLSQPDKQTIFTLKF